MFALRDTSNLNFPDLGFSAVLAEKPRNLGDCAFGRP